MRKLLATLVVTAVVMLGAPKVEANQELSCPARAINAEWIACQHHRHGHSQWSSGEGTPHHTWLRYQRDARRVRNYLDGIFREQLRRLFLVLNWNGVAACESGGNWAINTGNGYHGGLQFSMGTWYAYGGSGYPENQPAWYQSQIADRVRVQSGLQHWPHCGGNYG